MADKDYIERSKVMEHRVITDIGIWSGFVVPVKAIENIPAADVRPVVHGRWIAASDTSGNEYYRCSECGTYFEKTFFGNDYTVNGCPVCFADMRENTDQEQKTDDVTHGDICGATGLPCCRCNPGACESRK